MISALFPCFLQKRDLFILLCRNLFSFSLPPFSIVGFLHLLKLSPKNGFPRKPSVPHPKLPFPLLFENLRIPPSPLFPPSLSFPFKGWDGLEQVLFILLFSIIVCPGL